MRKRKREIVSEQDDIPVPRNTLGLIITDFVLHSHFRRHYFIFS